MRIFASALYANAKKTIVPVEGHPGLFTVKMTPNWNDYGANYFLMPDEQPVQDHKEMDKRKQNDTKTNR